MENEMVKQQLVEEYNILIELLSSRGLQVHALDDTVLFSLSEKDLRAVINRVRFLARTPGGV